MTRLSAQQPLPGQREERRPGAGIDDHPKSKRGTGLFSEEVLEQHKRLRTSLRKYLGNFSPAELITALVVYALVVPLALLDLAICLYQLICFPIWGISRVPRARYFLFDRYHLAYLNGIEKVHCLYCSYANGMIAFAREVAARTEQYWCPIKHIIEMPGGHGHYRLFVDYGDAEAFHRKLQLLREQLKTPDKEKSAPPAVNTAEPNPHH